MYGEHDHLSKVVGISLGNHRSAKKFDCIHMLNHDSRNKARKRFILSDKRYLISSFIIVEGNSRIDKLVCRYCLETWPVLPHRYEYNGTRTCAGVARPASVLRPLSNSPLFHGNPLTCFDTYNNICFNNPLGVIIRKFQCDPINCILLQPAAVDII